jgi:antitoxin FitA
VGRVKLGSMLAEIGREVGGVELDIEREKTPTEPVDLA